MAGTPRRRILLLNYEFPPMGGGAGHASFHLARTLAAAGHRVDVVTAGLRGQRRCSHAGRLRVYRVWSWRRSIQECGLRGAWSYVLCAQPAVQRLVRRHRYDIVHCFFGLPTGLLLLITPGLRRLPQVVSLRGSDVPGYEPHNRVLALIHRLLAPLTRRIWRQAGAVVALSASLRETAHRTDPTVVMDVIPNGIDAARFTPAVDGARRTTQGLELLTVARLVRRKGLEDLLEAVAHLRELPVRLTIQGAGPDADTLQRLAVRLGVADRVVFSGFRLREHLPEVYRAADLFVLPSHAESFGLAVLEAMACGLPVIVTAVGGMVEYVQPGVHGLLVPPGDPRALAEAIAHLERDPETRRQMGARNAALVRQRFLWSHVAAAYAHVYARLLTQAPAPAVAELVAVPEASHAAG